jgi:probable HAF family extracellular repeat protein
MRIPVLALLVVIALLMAIVPCSAADPARQFLAGFHGENLATGINDLGWVTGWYKPNQTEAAHVFVWKDGAVEDLGVVGQPTGINNAGTVVGYDRPTGVYEEVRSFVIINGIKTYLAGFDSPYLATGINDLGWVTGWRSLQDGSDHGFVWKDGGVTDLGMVASIAGVNNSGTVIGNDYLLPPEEGGPDPRGYRMQAPVPEPPSLIALCSSLLGLAGMVIRQRH